MTMSASLPTSATTTAGRGWAYLGAILGGAVSIAANIAHTYLVNPHPDALAVAVSVFWPAALFVCVEMLARVAWPTGRLSLVRWGVAPVAVVAGIVSYRHLSGLLAHYGEDPVTVALGPLGVDGLMLLATGAMIATRRRPATVADTATPERVADVTPAPVVALVVADDVTPAPANVTPANHRQRRDARPSRQSSADAIRDAATVPGATPASVAAAVGVSVRTCQRHWPRQSVVTSPALVVAAA